MGGTGGCCFGASNTSSSDDAVGSSSSGPADTVVIVGGQGDSPTSSSPGDSGSGGGNSAALQHKLCQQWDWLSCSHCLVMEVATTAAFFVSFWYWVGIVAIAGSGFSVSGGTLMAHAGNVVVALLQVVLTRLPIVSYHFQALLWYATVDEIFLWAFGGSTDIWRCGLDWQQPKPVAAFCIVPIVTFIMFILWFFAARIRERVLCAARKRASRHKQQQPQQQQQQPQPQQQESTSIAMANVSCAGASHHLPLQQSSHVPCAVSPVTPAAVSSRPTADC